MTTSIRNYLPVINKILKFTVSILALVYVTYRFINIPFNTQDIYHFINPIALLLITLLTICNWCFEFLKWKVVVDTFTHISFKKATYQTLVAYTYGIITPFNTGNYAKKIFFYPKQGKRIVFLNLCKGLYQMLVTVLFGSWGIYLLIDEIDTAVLNQQQLIIIGIVVGLMVLFIFKNKIITLIKSISLKTHVLLFLYSVVKFICFSLILIVLLHQNNLPVVKLYAGVCAVYLLSSLLPVLNILDFAIKGSIALWVLGSLGYLEAHILIAYFIIWICNHGLPAVTGSVLQFYHPKKED